MAQFRIIMFYPTIWDEDSWGDLALEDKCKLIKRAAEVALVEFKKKADTKYIFLAPEYVFYSGHKNKFCVPIKNRAPGLINGLKTLSNKLKDVLFIPGSGMFADESSKVQNVVRGFRNNEEVLACAKKEDVGEAPEGKFKPGTGSAVAYVDGIRYGLMICRDASRRGILKEAVDVLLVVSAGLALSNIVDPENDDGPLAAPRMRVLAERGGVNTQSPRECGGVEYRKKASDKAFTVAAPQDIALPDDEEQFAALHMAMKMWDVTYED